MAGEAAVGRRPFHRNPFLWAFLVGIAVITLIRPCLRRVPPPPPIGGRLPAFTLQDGEGRRFGPERLRGQVVIVHFFYVDCGPACADQERSLAEIRRAYADLGIGGIVVLSVSVDPERDTLDRLREFQARGGPDTGRWIVATGEPGALVALAREAFGLEAPPGSGPANGRAGPYGAAPPPGEPALAWLARAGRLLIVDGEGGLRGTYAADASGFDEVYNRAQHVRDEDRNPAGGPRNGTPGGDR